MKLPFIKMEKTWIGAALWREKQSNLAPLSFRYLVGIQGELGIEIWTAEACLIVIKNNGI